MKSVAHFGRYDLNSAQPLSGGDIISLKGVFSGGARNEMPVYEVQVAYSFYRLVLSSDTIPEAVDSDTVADLVQEYRYTDTRSNAGTKLRYPTSDSIVYKTDLTDAGAAGIVADKMLALLSERRLTLQMEVKLTKDLAAVIGIGAIVTVTIPYFNMESGRLGQIVGYDLNSAKNIATLDVWMAPFVPPEQDVDGLVTSDGFLLATSDGFTIILTDE